MHEIPQQMGRVTELIYTYHTIALAAGFILDLIFGDPRWLYHPVCLIGKLISSFEKEIRRVFPKTEKGELAGGLVEVILICVITLLVPAFVLYFLYIHLPVLGVLLETFWCYQLLATRSLRDESMKVYDALKKGTIEDARHAVSMIVGRDTAELTEEGVTKAAVETVAENTSDGVIAPMIYMAIGGVPLMFLYKGINTMDSMLGYKNDKYLYFGRFAAKLDDVLNFYSVKNRRCINGFIGGNCLTGRKKRRKALQHEKCVENFSARPKKAQQSDLTTVNKLINEVCGDIQTSFSNAELLALASQVFQYSIGDTTGFPFTKTTKVLSKKQVMS